MIPGIPKVPPEKEYEFSEGSEEGWRIVFNLKCWGNRAGETMCKHGHGLESHADSVLDGNGNPMMWHTYILPKAIGVYVSDGDYYQPLCLDCLMEKLNWLKEKGLWEGNNGSDRS